MKKIIPLLLLSVLYFCSTIPGAAEEKLSPVQTALSSTTISGSVNSSATFSPTTGFLTPFPPEEKIEDAASVPAQNALVPLNLGPVTITVTNAGDNGPGTLRQAVLDAVSGDSIDFALPLPAVIVLTNLQIIIDKSLTVSGPGAKSLTIQRSTDAGTPDFRIFRVRPGMVVQMSGLTLRNGRIILATTPGDNVGGAIYNSGTLTLSACDLIGNTAPDTVPTPTSGKGFGGGVFTTGALLMDHCNVISNTAGSVAGGINLFSSSSLRIIDSTVAGNYAGVQAGGINVQGSTGFVQNCTISGNTANSTGPGTGLGGGIVNVAFPNEASRLLLDHCTITLNTGLDYNGGVTTFGFNGSRIVSSLLKSTLVANNFGPNFTSGGTLATLSSDGHNLDTDGSSHFLNGFNGDIIGSSSNIIDAKLGPLQNNGGPTPTHALLAGSPALDTGDCLDFDGVTVSKDQRGINRPQGPACDIGAYENSLPTVSCPNGLTLECGVGGVACAKLTVVAGDADGDSLVVLWSVNGVVRQTNNLSAGAIPTSASVEFTHCYQLGTNVVTGSVSDGKAASTNCSTLVTVRDTNPPVIVHIAASPKVLWPPNHRMVPVKITVRTFDACECGPTICKIISVQSNEPINGLGDGDTAPDWQITGDLTLKLRAERSGKGNGRVYTITVRCTDCSGNSSTRKVRVLVPHALNDHAHDHDFDDERDDH